MESAAIGKLAMTIGPGSICGMTELMGYLGTEILSPACCNIRCYIFSFLSNQVYSANSKKIFTEHLQFVGLSAMMRELHDELRAGKPGDRAEEHF